MPMKRARIPSLLMANFLSVLGPYIKNHKKTRLLLSNYFEKEYLCLLTQCYRLNVCVLPQLHPPAKFVC